MSFGLKKYRMTHVFVPGGLPKYTYFSRSDLGLEERIQLAKDNLCKLVTVTGSTKSGKTVLTQQVFPKESTIWIDAGSVSDEKDLWTQIIDQLKGFTEVESSSAREKEVSATGQIGGQLKFPFFSGSSKAGTSIKGKRASVTTLRRQSSPKSTAINLIKESGKGLVIDDFHYLKREFQGSAVRALKGLVFDGHPVVLIAIPHRRYDAVKVEREMTQRIENIAIPPWNIDELEAIPKKGFEILNIGLNDSTCHKMSDEALGSPHLMQEFCRELCLNNGIRETQKTLQQLIFPNEYIDDIFKKVASNTGRAMFDKLAKGPRQRSDRKKRKLSDGTIADIYFVVLQAMALIRPGVESIKYEELRAATREVVPDDLPQAHQISRVLEHMARISAQDEASIPVIDWEKEEQVLHITDPFFAYYLRWGEKKA